MARKPNNTNNVNVAAPAIAADAPKPAALPRIRRAAKPAEAPAIVAAEPKPADKRSRKPAEAPAAPAAVPLTAATNNGRKPALVRTLIDGASQADAKKLRGKLRAAFAAHNNGVMRGSWQAYDNEANHAALAALLREPSAAKRAAMATAIVEAARKPAADPKPARKPRAAKPAVTA